MPRTRTIPALVVVDARLLGTTVRAETTSPLGSRGFAGTFRRALAVVLLSLPWSIVATAAPTCIVGSPGAPACGAPPDPGIQPRTRAAPRHVGNPIDVLGGNKYQREDDYRAVGSPLAFARHYNSALTDYDLGLGRGWRHSYHVFLTRLDDATLQIVQADGRRMVFTAASTVPGEPRGLTPSSNHYASPGGHDGHVVQTESGDHLWHLPDGRRLQFRGSWLVRTMREGVPSATLTLHYERLRLASVTDALGRSLRLRYTPGPIGLRGYDPAFDVLAPGHLEALVLPGGEEVEIRYDNRLNPVVTRHPDGAVTTLAYDDDAWPHHLTKRRTEDHERAWSYDEHGRAVAFHDEETNRSLTVDYGTASAQDTTGDSIVRRESGATSIYRWQRGSAHEERRVVSTIERACEDCPPSTYLPPSPPNDPSSSITARGASSRSVEIDDGPRSGQITDTGPRPSTGEEPGAGRHKATSVVSPVTLSADSPYTLTYTDELGREVTLETDIRGNIVDVVRDGVSLNELSWQFMYGGGIACDSTGEGRDDEQERALSCLAELFELQDIANDPPIEPAPFTPRSRSREIEDDTARFCTTPNGRTCSELERDLEMARLSRCAYSSSRFCTASYERVEPRSIDLEPRDFDFKGFSATLYRNRGTDEYVLAFRGTDSFFRYDLKENLLQFAGVVTSQYRHAHRLSEKLAAALPEKVLSYTGHSLGGGLATTAALNTDRPATVFNSAALHENTAKALDLEFGKAPRFIDNLTVDGEFVTTRQDTPRYPPGYRVPEHDRHVGRPAKISTPAPGRRFLLPPPSDAWMDAQEGDMWKSIRLHLMSTVIESLLSVLEFACGVKR